LAININILTICLDSISEFFYGNVEGGDTSHMSHLEKSLLSIYAPDELPEFEFMIYTQTYTKIE